MKQYRDDLLASCLTFILSLPKEVISEQMEDVVPAIQVFTADNKIFFPFLGPDCEKTCLQGFRPGHAKTTLLNYTD